MKRSTGNCSIERAPGVSSMWLIESTCVPLWSHISRPNAVAVQLSFVFARIDSYVITGKYCVGMKMS